jgi:hypothetical protein
VKELHDLRFVEIDPDTARVFHETLHYIGSFRKGQHFALQDADKQIYCQGSIAACDLSHVLAKLDIDPSRVLMFTRFFAYDWAPKNAFSYFTGRLRSHLRQLPRDIRPQMLMTFIDPNRGFQGVSHVGAKFEPFAIETGHRKMYLKGEYKTMRYFVETYGTNDPDKLQKALGEDFSQSLELLPLKILAAPLCHKARLCIPAEPHVLQRPIIHKMT